MLVGNEAGRVGADQNSGGKIADNIGQADVRAVTPPA